VIAVDPARYSGPAMFIWHDLAGRLHYRAAIRDSARLELSILCSSRWIGASRTAQPAPQSRSNPVSGRCLQKTGIFQISAGDYRLIRAGSGQIRSLETGRQFAKARHWRAFLAFPVAKSLRARLPGWRRSADRTRLHASSLLTGNFTGNFTFLGL
jgi:hypothetical protein